MYTPLDLTDKTNKDQTHKSRQKEIITTLDSPVSQNEIGDQIKCFNSMSFGCTHRLKTDLNNKIAPHSYHIKYQCTTQNLILCL